MKIYSFFPQYKFFDSHNTKSTQKQEELCSNLPSYTFEQAKVLKNLAFLGNKHIYDIKKLIKSGELHENATIHGIQKASRLNEDAFSDLEKLKYAKKHGKNPADVFVPDFEDENTAKENLSVGDVCQIKGDKFISIVDGRGEIKKLALSKEKYMELFPPVARFSVMQNKIGDCWLLSALNAMYICPSTRAILLSTYRENELKGIDINFKGFDSDGNNAYEKDNNEKTIKNTNNYTALRAFSPKGFACAEEAYEQRQAEIAHKRIETMYNVFCKAIDSEKTGEIYIDDIAYSREDAKEFIKTAKPFIGDSVGMSKILFDPKAKEERVELNEYKFEEYLEKLDSDEFKEHFTKSEIDLMKRILLRNNEWLKRKARYQRLIQDVVPTSLFVKYSNKNNKKLMTEEELSRETATPYIIGGKTEELLRLYGLYAFNSGAPEREADNAKKHWVLVAGSGKEDVKKNGYEISGNHAYAIKLLNDNGKRRFGVRDPHNSSLEIVMDKKEIGEVFDSITYGFDDGY